MFRFASVFGLGVALLAFGASERDEAVSYSVQRIGLPETAWKVTYSGALDRIVYATYDGDVVCLDRASERELWRRRIGGFPFCMTLTDVQGDGVQEVLLSTAFNRIALIGLDGRVRLNIETAYPPYSVDFGGGLLYWLGPMADAVRIIDPAGEAVGEVALSPEGVKPYYRPSRVRLGVVDERGEPDLLVFRIRGALQTYDPATGAFRGVLENMVPVNALRSPGEDVPTPADRRDPLPEWRGNLRNFILWDVDGDGREEICGANIRWKWPGGCVAEIAVVDGTDRVVWRRPLFDGVDLDRPETLCDDPKLALVAAGDGPDSERLAVLFGPNLYLLDREGAVRHAGRCGIDSFTHMAASTDGQRARTLVIGSAAMGIARSLYCLTPDSTADVPFSSLHLAQDPFAAQMLERLDSMKAQLSGKLGRHDPQDPPYLFNIQPSLFPGPWNPSANEAVTENLRTAFRRYGVAIGMGSNAALLYAGELEKRGIPHYVTLSHQSRIFPNRGPDRVRELFESAPDTCRGVAFHETQALVARPTSGAMRHYFRAYLLPILDVCAEAGKSAYFQQKTGWYVIAPAHPATRGLFDQKYRDHLVLSHEDSLCLASELDLMATTGLYLSGAGRPMASVIPDLFRMVRFMNDETDLKDPSILLRYLVTRAFLGAREFRLQYRDDLFSEAVYDDDPKVIFAPLGRQVLETFVELLHSRVVCPPRPGDIVGISPVAISMNPPDPTFMHSANIQKKPNIMAPASRAGLLSGFDWGGYKASEAYLPSYILGIEHHAHNFAFETPYGMPVILPHWSPAKASFNTIIETDGTHVLTGDGRKTGRDARDEVAALFERAADDLPFRAERVFCIGNRLDADTVRILLCDPKIYTPEDVVTTLSIRDDVRVTGLRDALTGESLPVRDHRARIRVPAGLFRIVDLETRAKGR